MIIYIQKERQQQTLNERKENKYDLLQSETRI